MLKSRLQKKNRKGKERTKGMVLVNKQTKRRRKEQKKSRKRLRLAYVFEISNAIMVIWSPCTDAVVNPGQDIQASFEFRN